MEGKEGGEGLRLNQLPSKDSFFGFERWVRDMLHIAVQYFSVIYPNINNRDHLVQMLTYLPFQCLQSKTRRTLDTNGL